MGNTMRMIPGGLRLRVAWESWERPAIFRLIQRTGSVPDRDMRRTFNLGIGLVVVVSSHQAPDVLTFLRRRGEPAFLIGDVIRSV